MRVKPTTQKILIYEHACTVYEDKKVPYTRQHGGKLDAVLTLKVLGRRRRVSVEVKSYGVINTL